MVSDVTFSGLAESAQNTTNSQVTLADDFSDFLTLLTTQLQNQDPTDPLDTNQFTEQLVQFSQVEQQINTNQKLDDLVALQLNSAITNALGYVGLDVSYISAEIPFDGQTAAPIRYSLDTDALVANINIFDESRNLVFSGPAETTAGVHDFQWDGTDLLGQPVPEGTYLVSVDAADTNENPVSTTTVVTGRVKGIEQQDGTVFALVGDRAVDTNAILNAQTPNETLITTEGDDAPTS